MPEPISIRATAADVAAKAGLNLNDFHDRRTWQHFSNIVRRVYGLEHSKLPIDVAWAKINRDITDQVIRKAREACEKMDVPPELGSNDWVLNWRLSHFRTEDQKTKERVARRKNKKKGFGNNNNGEKDVVEVRVSSVECSAGDENLPLGPGSNLRRGRVYWDPTREDFQV